jgi:hypothetical protein
VGKLKKHPKKMIYDPLNPEKIEQAPEAEEDKSN